MASDCGPPSDILKQRYHSWRNEGTQVSRCPQGSGPGSRPPLHPCPCPLELGRCSPPHLRGAERRPTPMAAVMPLVQVVEIRGQMALPDGKTFSLPTSTEERASACSSAPQTTGPPPPPSETGLPLKCLLIHSLSPCTPVTCSGGPHRLEWRSSELEAEWISCGTVSHLCRGLRMGFSLITPLPLVPGYLSGAESPCSALTPCVPFLRLQTQF